MITSAKNYIKNKNKKRTDRTLGQMVKAKLYRTITPRNIHIHTHKKRKGKKYISLSLYIYKKEERNQINKQIHQ